MIDEPCLPPLRPTIDVKSELFSEAELRAALKKLKREKACGPDGLPPEYFKAILQSDCALMEILGFCNRCWELKQVPEDWHMARVSQIFKKGDPLYCTVIVAVSCLFYKSLVVFP